MSEAAQAEGVEAPENDAPDSQEAEAKAKPDTEKTEPESSTGGDDKPTDKSEAKGVQKRIDELTRNWREAQRENERLWKMVETRQEVPAPPPQAPPEPVKTLKDFEYDESAFMQYATAKATAEAEAKASEIVDSKLQTWQQQQQEATNRQSFESRAAEFAKEHSDYYSKVGGDVAISEPMANAITAAENGPEVAYYLANNPDLSISIYNKPPPLAAYEIGKIEARLVAQRESAAVKQVSQAPEPTPKIDASEPGLRVKASEPDSDKISIDEWMRLREKEISKR